MDNRPWKHTNVWHTSCSINESTFLLWKTKKNKTVLPWLLTAFFLSSPFTFSSPLTISPSLSSPVASDSSIMHSCSLTGRAFWNYAGSCEAETITLMRCSRGAIMSLNKTGTARHLCALFLLQPNQEQIVFEGLVIKTPAVQLRLRVWLPSGLMNTFTSPSMSAPAAK